MKKLLTIPVFLPVLFVISCSSAPDIKPDWVINEPNTDDEYWVGIGIIEKPLPDDYREIPQQRALNEITSQISVQLTSGAFLFLIINSRSLILSNVIIYIQL